MLYLDYSWDLSPMGIKFDEELDIDRLGWKGGDLFEVANVNGQAMLRKVDPVIAFAKGYKVNCDE
jgi:hypothetical protein